MNTNILPSNRAVLAARIDPDAYTTGDESSGWVDMAVFENIQAIVCAGTLGASATLDAKLEQATNKSGGSAKDITGKAITQLTKASGQDDVQAIINCRSDELDTNNGFTHVRLTMTVGTATSDAGAVILGHDARYQPADGGGAVDISEVVA
ncbi:hypothetical protein [Kiloniella antarctica]|uniref:Uncharacterized protein n=1 Tax=Kiloniella antarctica TaxID=1550907 RepID=A0ABW5BL56_9PROT